MDAWSAEQLQRMQLGGNDALNAFLKNYGVDKYTDIRDKYNSQAAEVSLDCWTTLVHLHCTSAPICAPICAVTSFLCMPACKITPLTLAAVLSGQN